MVSFGKLGLAFLCTPRFNHRHQTTQYSDKYNRITPLNVNLPFFETSTLFEGPADQLIQNLSNKALDVLSDEGLEWDYGNKLSRLDLNKRTSILKETVTQWTDKGPDFTAYNLSSFKDIVNSLDLPVEDVYITLLEILNFTKDKDSTGKVCLLCDIYKPNDSEKNHFYVNNSLIKEENIDLFKLVREAKESVLNKEFEKILDDELSKHEKSKPPNRRKLETNYELNKLRKTLLVAYPNHDKKINSLSNKKLIDHSVELNRLIWEINFYEDFDLVEIPEYILESVDEDANFGSQTFNNLLYTRVSKVQDLIKNIVDPSEEVHVVNIHIYYLERQYEYSLQKFNEWLETARQKLDKLKECGLDLHRDNVQIKNIGEAGGEMPLINITPICPEYPKLLEPNQLEEEFDFIEKRTKEQKKKFLKDIQKTKAKLRYLSHMTTEEMSDFVMKKVPSEIQIARKAKQRRMRIRELNNPFNTSEDLPPFKELRPKVIEEDENKKQKEITADLSKEEVDDILSEINTEYIRHNMNLKHLEWHIKSSKTNSRRSLYNLLKSEQDVKNPDPKKLSFEGDQFNKTFEWLSEFVEDPNSEVHKYRRQLFNSGNKNNSKDNKDNKYLKRISIRDLNKIRKQQSEYLPEDPEATLDDDPIIKDLLKAGASLNCVMKWPHMELTPNPTKSQMETNFYKMSISQPSPIYRCTKCDYRIFSQPVTTYSKNRINPVEYNDYINEDEYKCKNCGADKSNFEEVWTTGEAKYELPHMVKKVKEQEEEEDD